MYADRFRFHVHSIVRECTGRKSHGKIRKSFGKMLSNLKFRAVVLEQWENIKRFLFQAWLLLNISVLKVYKFQDLSS